MKPPSAREFENFLADSGAKLLHALIVTLEILAVEHEQDAAGRSGPCGAPQPAIEAAVIERVVVRPPFLELPAEQLLSEVIEFDYSPRKSSSIGSVLSMKKDSEDIEFDYSPRPVKCWTSYC